VGIFETLKFDSQYYALKYINPSIHNLDSEFVTVDAYISSPTRNSNTTSCFHL
jgi:hypothetical protein